MASSLSSQYCVALSGQKWDVGNFTLWQSTDDDVILFSPKQATLSRDLNKGRYQTAVSQFRVQKDGAYKTVGGAALFTISTGIEFDADAYKQIVDQWREEVQKSGKAKSTQPRFMPLVTRKGTMDLLIPEIMGTASQSTIANREFGVIGSKVALLANLTSEGAQALAQAIKNHENTPIGVAVRYEYLQTLPVCSVEITLNGSRVFQHLSAQLKASYDGFLYGGSIDLQGQWESMVRNGAITMKVTGLDALPPGAEEMKQNALNTFIDQAFKNFFPMLFAPKPDVKAAEAGKSGGWFGGTNFALKWRKESDVSNLSLKMEFGGYTWLKGAMDTGATLLSGLDNSYLNEVNTELTFPVLVNVSSDPMVKTVSVSCSAMESGRPVMIPAADLFGADVPSKSYLITSQNPDKVAISYKAKIDFNNSKFPIIEESGSTTGAKPTIDLKPSARLGEVDIYLYTYDSNGNFAMPEEKDELVVNVSVAGSHLKTAIKESARIKPFPDGEPIHFVYPMPIDGSQPVVKFSAFGVINGKLVRAKEQPITLDEASIFIVVDKNGVRLVSKEADLPESDPIADRLLSAGTSPVISFGDAAGSSSGNGKTSESEQTGNGNGSKTAIAGTLTAVEYGKFGPALWVEDSSGKKQRVRLHDVREADPFDDEGRKQVKVLMDETGYAESIVVEL